MFDRGNLFFVTLCFSVLHFLCKRTLFYRHHKYPAMHKYFYMTQNDIYVPCQSRYVQSIGFDIITFFFLPYLHVELIKEFQSKSLHEIMNIYGQIKNYFYFILIWFLQICRYSCVYEYLLSILGQIQWSYHLFYIYWFLKIFHFLKISSSKCKKN